VVDQADAMLRVVLEHRDPGLAAGRARRYVRTMTQPTPQNAEKDPDDWVTGDEPMTGAQASYLQTLAQQAGQDVPPEDLSKADASRRIDELQGETGRGR